MLNHASGMVALSGLANDVRAVRRAASNGDGRAVLALKVFTRSVRKAIGEYCWLMGGVDAIVFTGGIGEHDAATRAEVLDQGEELGFEDRGMGGASSGRSYDCGTRSCDGAWVASSGTTVQHFGRGLRKVRHGWYRLEGDNVSAGSTERG